MSKEGSPELTKSWVFVNPNNKTAEDDKDTKDTSGVQEVIENEPHIDSDTDSISVISESGCSYKTDEEEFTPTAVPEQEDNDDKTETEEEEADIKNKECENVENEPKIVENEPEFVENEPEISENEPEFVENELEISENEPEFVENEPAISENETELIEPRLSEASQEDKRIEKLLYFATSAFCALILIGLSVAVQQYLQGAFDINTFDPDQKFHYPHVQSVETEDVISETPPKKFSSKRRSQFKLEELENKVAKLQEDNEIHDKIVGDSDPSMEGNVKSNYKLNKNKIQKCNKENCDAKIYKHEKIRTVANDQKTTDQGSDADEQPDETYTMKIKELKVKEDYLKEKEKFLIEKEHDLLKKEIKLHKEKQNYGKNKHDKKPCFRKENYKDGSSKEEKGRFKQAKEFSKDTVHVKTDKRFKHREEPKEYSTQKKYKFANEGSKKLNISGQWYINLHEARDNMRQKKRSSFKKNKAHWYFQWMVDRARLRVK